MCLGPRDGRPQSIPSSLQVNDRWCSTPCQGACAESGSPGTPLSPKCTTPDLLSVNSQIPIAYYLNYVLLFFPDADRPRASSFSRLLTRVSVAWGVPSRVGPWIVTFLHVSRETRSTSLIGPSPERKTTKGLRLESRVGGRKAWTPTVPEPILIH